MKETQKSTPPSREEAEDERLQSCDEVMATLEGAHQVVEGASKTFKEVFDDDRKHVHLMMSLLQDEVELQAMKGEVPDAAIPPAQLRKSRTNVGLTVTQLQRIHDLSDVYNARIAMLQNFRRQLDSRQGEAARDLEAVREVLAAKRQECAEYVRVHCPPPVEKLTPNVLKKIFSKLSMNDLVTAGQVCQKWRKVSRSEESLWKCNIFTSSEGRMWYYRDLLRTEARILKAAPCANVVLVNHKTESLVTASKCKVRGLDFRESASYDTTTSILKSNVAHLRALRINMMDGRLADILICANLTVLHINLMGYKHSKFKFSNLTLPKNSLKELMLDGYVPSSVVISTLNISSFSLRKLLLFSSKSRDEHCCWHHDDEETVQIISAVFQCSNLKHLAVPLCYTAHNLDNPRLHLESLTLVVGMSTYVNYDMTTNKASSRYINRCRHDVSHAAVAPTTLKHLKIICGNRCHKDLFRSIGYINRMSSSLRSSLESLAVQTGVCEDSRYVKECRAVLSNLSELSGKWSIEEAPYRYSYDEDDEVFKLSL